MPDVNKHFKETATVVKDIKDLKDLNVKQWPEVKDGFCVVCGYPSNAHGWQCITYFINLSTSFMAKRVKSARNLIYKIVNENGVTTEEAKKVLYELETTLKIRDGISE